MARARVRDGGVAWTRRKLLLLLASTAAVISAVSGPTVTRTRLPRGIKLEILPRM